MGASPTEVVRGRGRGQGKGKEPRGDCRLFENAALATRRVSLTAPGLRGGLHRQPSGQGHGSLVTVGNVSPPVERPPRGQLVFDACFESGNLGRVDAISRCEYDLFIRPDTCNSKYRVWFYFSVDNAEEKQRVVFNIVNFSKLRSLFDTGSAAPVMRTEGAANWQRIPAKHLYYYRSALHGDRYVLSFAYVFETPPTKAYFAYSIPYTYTQLRSFLAGIETRELPFFTRRVLTETLQKREVDLVTIEDDRLNKRKKMVFITARVHPGEAPSSHVVHGLIEFLVSDDARAVKLRSEASFKIVPMLNPDGVVLGNYRCSLLGVDLNRHWVRPSPWAEPTIYATRNLLVQYESNPLVEVVLYVDVHAHSQKTNSFLYGNTPWGEACRDRQLWLPHSLARLADDFSLASTQFNRDADKEGTGRRAMGAILSCHCYTLEVSFFSYRPNDSIGSRPIPYLAYKYETLGEHLTLAILHFVEALNDERSIAVVASFTSLLAKKTPLKIKGAKIG